MIYWEMFYEFFKIGLFAVGGGMATIPFLNKLADATGWFTRTDLLNMIAVSESTPGPIGVNTATYVGFHTAGILGGVVATFGLVLPSYIVISIVSQFLKKFGDSKYVKATMYGLRAASAGLIAAAGFSVAEVTLLHSSSLAAKDYLAIFNWPAILMAVILVFLTKKYKKIHPIAFLAASAVVGIVCF